jgi:dTDP-4-amino-4,6-dideoxygalactose transaminase
MSNIVAAIGRGQLEVLDDRVHARRKIFDSYVQSLSDLPGLSFMPEANYGKSNRWLTVILLDPKLTGTTPEKIRLALESENIEARPVWKPLHMQPVFNQCTCQGGSVAERIFAQGLCLPSGTAMSPEDFERVTKVIRRCF